MNHNTELSAEMLAIKNDPQRLLQAIAEHGTDGERYAASKAACKSLDHLLRPILEAAAVSRLQDSGEQADDRPSQWRDLGPNWPDPAAELAWLDFGAHYPEAV